MEEVNEIKYLGSVLCKHASMDGKARERAVNGDRWWCIGGSYERKKCEPRGKEGQGKVLPCQFCQVCQRRGHGLQHSN